jgi:CDP-glycerol glycerophosphotransferase (TagB/SpsB family)
MSHSDVVVNICSTIAIDAAVVDTPSICIAFDRKPGTPYFRSCRRYTDFDHFQNLIKAGGVRIAYSFDDLLEYIRQYLANPALDREGRTTIRREQCYFEDGLAGYRCAQVVLRELGLLGQTVNGVPTEEPVVSPAL